MRRVQMKDTTWSQLLGMRGQNFDPRRAASDPAYALYGALASTDGPMVLAQVGQSLDGRVATPFGDARDISGPDGLAHLHRCRALMDAVIVGVGTVKADNPRLSVREVEGRSPVRVVIDCHGELAGDEGLFHDGGAPVIVVRSDKAPRKPLPADVIQLHRHDHGLCPHEILEALTDRGLHKILVEGGARTIARFLDQGLVDHLHVCIAPLIIGSGPSGISLPPIRMLSEAHRPLTEVFSLGSDILFDCRLGEKEAPSGRPGKKISVSDNTALATAEMG
ncbi:RibD family protein [Rhizobium helianthi]|uniref:RibD family protein n=1 Tax=Rhizobium helianthi TaxID=1132695 RepID=A0ABW4M255_9HYPH